MPERLKLLRRYLQNNRIEDYSDILSTASAHDYQMISLEKSAKKDMTKSPHPVSIVSLHWKYNPKGQLREVVKSIIKKPIHTKENFKRIAK